MGDSDNRVLEHLITRFLELVGQVDVGRGDECMDTRMLSALYCFPGPVDVSANGSGESGYGATLNRSRDEPDRLKISHRGNGETCLDDIDAHPFELTCHLQFLFHIH